MSGRISNNEYIPDGSAAKIPYALSFVSQPVSAVATEMKNKYIILPLIVLKVEEV